MKFSGFQSRKQSRQPFEINFFAELRYNNLIQSHLIARPFSGKVGCTKIESAQFNLLYLSSEDGVEPDGHAVSLLGDLKVDLRSPRLY